MLCVISRWSPDLIGFRSLCDNRIKFRSVPFHFGWRVLPCCPWGEEVDALSLLPMGGEKNLEGMGETAVHRAKSLHNRDDNIMPVVNEWIPWLVYVVVWYICDNLPYVRYYGFWNYIVAHRLLYTVSRYLLWETLCFIIQSFLLYHIIIIENETCISPTPINYATY